MKMISFELTAEQIATIVGESQTFKSLVIARLFESTTDKRQRMYGNEHINRLYWYVQDNYDRVNSKIAAIKYVRQYVGEHQSNIDNVDYENLKSLYGAKEFVEKALGVGIYK